ncbi:MAG: alanine racemase [Flavobacteriaceae bacterium]|nr:alanine racemase [Flavobacteriaceae bacterium]
MITKPTLLLDEHKCRSNLKKMVGKARRNKIEFRPHFKTHQSCQIGAWFREEGVTKITVSSVEMAMYFAADGWKDITIAFPVNILEIENINKLAKSVKLNLLVESIEIIQLLEEKLTTKANVFVKINIGNNRAGIEPQNTAFISNLLTEISRSEKLKFKGFLGHAGNSYACRGKEEIAKIHLDSTSKMTILKREFIKEYPDLILSVGDTPTCSVMEDFSMVDEIRPGVFIFNDLMQLQIGACAIDQLAIAMACPVVAIHKDKNELIIYGGSVHFASDSMFNNDGYLSFGSVIENNTSGWGKIVEDVYVKKLSQEHGIIKATPEFLSGISLGDILKIIPVHACTNANLFETYVTLEGEKIGRFRF